MLLHIRTLECHLTYGNMITQCYLSPNTSEHTPPQPDRPVLNLPPRRDGRLSWKCTFWSWKLCFCITVNYIWQIMHSRGLSHALPRTPLGSYSAPPDPLADGRGSLPLTNYPIPALGLRSQFLGLARPSCAVQSKTLTGNGTQVGLHHWRIKAWAGRASGDPHRPKVGAVVITARSSLPRTRGQAASYHLNR